MARRTVRYLSDSRLAEFLPQHLRDARDAGITIISANWHPESGCAYVEIEGIDRDNPAHAAVGEQASTYTREVVEALPPADELVAVSW